MKRKLMSFIMAIVCSASTVLTTATITAFADDQVPVAKVGETEYTTIDEAIDNWTSNTTLTLLADVTLSDTVTIKSTEHHTLNLGTYDMTAAENKNAIEILSYGTGDAERNALTVNADKTDPGAINAGSKSCISYQYSTTYTTSNDRPIITINNGVFNGGTSSFGKNVGIYGLGVRSEQRKCATLTINGGIFNCAINLATMGKMIINGGTFNASVGGQGGATAYRHIAGGRFKTFGFMTADENPNKFSIGSTHGVNDYYVYIDSDQYICVYNKAKIGSIAEADFIAENGITAKTVGTAEKRNTYLQYSSAVNGLYYVDSELAFSDFDKKNSTTKDIVFYEGAAMDSMTVNTSLEVDLTANEVLPTDKVVLNKASSTFAFTCYEDQVPDVTVTTSLPAYEVVESRIALMDAESNKVSYVYSLNKLPTYAKIGSTEYVTLLDAVAAAKAGDVITLLDNVSEDGFVVDKNLTLNLNGFTYTIEGTVGSAGTETNGLQLLKGANVTIKNGTITSGTAQMLVQNYSNLTLDGVVLDGANLAGNMPYTLSNNCGSVAINNSTIIASANGVAFDVCDYATYTAPVVTVVNSTINGKIEMTDCNGGAFAGGLVDGENTYTALGNYLQMNGKIVSFHEYNITLNVSDNTIHANDEITVEVVVDKEYYSLDYAFRYDATKFSCEQDENHDGVIEVKFLTEGTAGVLATYKLKALNDIDRAVVASMSVEGNVLQYAVQALNDLVNKVSGETEEVKIALDYTAEMKTDYVTGYTLVLIKGDYAGFAYDGQKMFFVTEYDAYAILVEGVVAEEAIDDILTTATDCEVITKSYNVNVEYVLDGKVDLKDATSVYACYNLDFSVNELMEVFLRADVNNDYCVNYADVNEVIANYTK